LIVLWKLFASAVKVDEGGVVGVGLSLEEPASDQNLAAEVAHENAQQRH
jgi:hypothetical protein